MGFGTCGVRCACGGTDSRGGENVHDTWESREAGRDEVGKGEVRIRSGKKKKQSKNDEIGLRSTFKFETRTLIGAPTENEGRTDQIIRRDSCPPYPERAPFGSATFGGGGRRRG